MESTSSVDRSPSLIVRPFIFPKADWAFTGEGEQRMIQGVPGTWHDRWPGAPHWLLGLVCCPNCHNVSTLGKQVHQVDHVGKLSPSFQCKYGTCTFHRDAYLDDWNNKPLYAMAVERDGKCPEIHYTHAHSAEEARIQLGSGNYHIAAIGRAIGFFVDDKEGLDLSAD